MAGSNAMMLEVVDFLVAKQAEDREAEARAQLQETLEVARQARA